MWHACAQLLSDSAKGIKNGISFACKIELLDDCRKLGPKRCHSWHVSSTVHNNNDRRANWLLDALAVMLGNDYTETLPPCRPDS